MDLEEKKIPLAVNSPIIGQITNSNTEVKVLGVYLFGSETHSISIILPSIKTKSNLIKVISLGLSICLELLSYLNIT
jgi:hypothetical protein